MPRNTKGTKLTPFVLVSSRLPSTGLYVAYTLLYVAYTLPLTVLYVAYTLDTKDTKLTPFVLVSPRLPSRLPSRETGLVLNVFD